MVNVIQLPASVPRIKHPVGALPTRPPTEFSSKAEIEVASAGQGSQKHSVKVIDTSEEEGSSTRAPSAPTSFANACGQNIPPRRQFCLASALRPKSLHYEVPALLPAEGTHAFSPGPGPEL